MQYALGTAALIGLVLLYLVSFVVWDILRTALFALKAAADAIADFLC